MRNLSPVQKHILRNTLVIGSIEPVETTNPNDTTNQDSGDRTRKLSGIFLSQIPIIEPLTQSDKTEFAVRLRERNKASNRTNKLCPLSWVVDYLTAPTCLGRFILFTKKTGNPPMNKSVIKYSLNTHAPIPFTSAMEVANA